MSATERVIERTKKWITEVVIGCNFCPFAANVVKRQIIYYQVETSAEIETCLDSFLSLVKRMDDDPTVETSFLIFPNSFEKFDDYLDLVDVSENLLKHKGYEGIYQVASFHPMYLFEGSNEDDPANYTNRSVYPMLHLLREESIDKALENYKDPESIPDRNIKFAREKGLAYMKMLKDAL